MKKYIIASSLLFVLLVIVSVCGYFLYQKINFKPIKCTIGGTYYLSIGDRTIGNVSKLDEKNLIFVLDERKKQILDLDKHPMKNYKVKKLTKSSLHFSDEMTSENTSSENHYDLNRFTGEITGIGNYDEVPKTRDSLSFSYLYKGTCEPYKIEKKF